jgi:hypothetical protein
MLRNDCEFYVKLLNRFCCLSQQEAFFKVIERTQSHFSHVHG